MRFFQPVAAIAIAAVGCCGLSPLKGEQPITPLFELQSGPLTPGLVLPESPRPIHQIRLVVDARLQRGVLVLDGNPPEFNEFGELIGGIQTPHVPAQGNPAMMLELPCTIERVKVGPKKQHLYRIKAPQLLTPLRLATRGSLADGGGARLLVVGPHGQVKAVVPCVHYGLAPP